MGIFIDYKSGGGTSEIKDRKKKEKESEKSQRELAEELKQVQDCNQEKERVRFFEQMGKDEIGIVFPELGFMPCYSAEEVEMRQEAIQNFVEAPETEEEETDEAENFQPEEPDDELSEDLISDFEALEEEENWGEPEPELIKFEEERI